MEFYGLNGPAFEAGLFPPTQTICAPKGCRRQAFEEEKRRGIFVELVPSLSIVISTFPYDLVKLSSTQRHVEAHCRAKLGIVESLRKNSLTCRVRKSNLAVSFCLKKTHYSNLDSVVEKTQMLLPSRLYCF